MKQQMKQWIKNKLVDRQVRQYHRLLEQKTVTYDAWIRDAERRWGANQAESKEDVEAKTMQIRHIPYEVCEEYVKGTVMQSDVAEVVLFLEENGEVSAIAEEVVANFFENHGKIDLAYGDEDVMSPEGIRYTPWFKPDWSPDTFLSHFYFGNIFAVRMSALRTLTEEEKQWIWKEDIDCKMGVYRLCYILAVKSGGFARRQGEFPIGHMDEVLFHASRNRELETAGSQAIDATGCPTKCSEIGRMQDQEGDIPLLSVVIPSKDNAQVLKRCIQSVQSTINEPVAYEIIVVDNGSGEAVRQELENWVRQQGDTYYYIYQPMPFHFSKMCNLGAQKAKGKVLLFLNDDVELPESGWGDESVGEAGQADDFLGMLYEMARRPFTGAVGVKLYYPKSQRIQHAGIVNLRLGPVHKLQFKEDEESYYYGWNRKRRNVIAVTGACLAVEKQKFEEIGGFPQELPVAFNDVDLCFSLFEKGYYNVVLQDVTLFHHESLSRGNDDNRGKLQRLLGEKDKLYERHKGLYGIDPFYHKYLAGDMLSTGFELRADYDAKPQMVVGRMQVEQGLLTDARQDACVMISLEYAGTVDANQRQEASYLLQGYSFITGSDNACFEKYLIFMQDVEKYENEETHDTGEQIWYVKAEPFIRKDVECNLPDQVHVGMTGFCMELAKGELPRGSYRVGVMVRDKCSGQKIYSWTNRYLTVD